MKVRVDFDLCESNALCTQVLPDVFELDDDDVLHVLTDTVPPGEHDAVETAVRRCPRQAITIVA